MLIPAEPSRDKLPLCHDFQEQVLVGVQEAASLSVEADLRAARLDAPLDSLFVELVRDLIQERFLHLVHSVVL